MSTKNESLTVITNNNPWEMSIQEVTAHIADSDKKSTAAQKQCEAAEAVFKEAQKKANYHSKYARLTRDFTKKILSCSTDEKEKKVRQSYRAKFGALEATKVVSVPKKAPVTKEESRLTVTQAIDKVSNLVESVKTASAMVANTENQNQTPVANKQGS